MRRLAVAVAALALFAAGCGDDSSSSSIPRGSPDERHGPQAVDNYASVELLRALLVASSDGYYSGGSAEDATTQLGRALRAYQALQTRVKAEDPVVDREVSARFTVLARFLRRGVTPDRYRDLAGPLADQLMDGVAQALVPQAARTDRGVQAEALRRVTGRLSATYAASAGGSETGRLAFEEAWGLYRRALALTALIKPDLGGQKDSIARALNALRDKAFADGPAEATEPAPDDVDAARQKVDSGLAARFRL